MTNTRAADPDPFKGRGHKFTCFQIFESKGPPETLFTVPVRKLVFPLKLNRHAKDKCFSAAFTGKPQGQLNKNRGW